MELDGEPAVRRRDEHPPADAQRLGDEGALALGRADVLDDRVREDDVEGAVGKGQRARVPLDVGDVRVGGAEAGAVVEAERA